MDKNRKKDLINKIILVLFFLGVVLFLTRFKFLYGSELDWETQHWTFAEYFRRLFYKTYDLFPSFAFNIGAGENIYNFSYYGFLNPIILIAYFLPFVKMLDYVMLSSIIGVIVSVLLFYKWLDNKGYSSFITFLCSFIFLLSGPLILHSHRHIMFVNYMPFLIMGLMSIDNYFKKGVRWPLILSVFLIIMTSYYFSIPSLMVLVIYGIYEWLKQDRVTVKDFFKDGFKFLVPIIIGIILASIILLPTFYTLFVGRSSNTVSINYKELLIPNIHLDYLLYGSYSMGLTAIAVVAVIYGFLSKKRENIFLALIISLICLFPILGYVLNGFLYINAKVFIPFVPLVVYLIGVFLKDLLEDKVEIKKLVLVIGIFSLLVYISSYNNFLSYLIDVLVVVLMVLLYYFKKFKWGLFGTTLLTSVIVMLNLNLSDGLMSIENYNYIFNDKIDKLYQNINDDNIYRSSNLVDTLVTSNKTYDNYYGTSTYSSGYNSYYKEFFTDTFGNPISHRNHLILSQINNPLWDSYMGVKYIVNDKEMNYKKVLTLGDYSLYQNEVVYPLGYVRNQVMSKKEFDSLEYPYNIEALMKYTIVDEEIPKTNFVRTTKEIKLDLDNIPNISYELEDGHYKFKLKEDQNFNIPIEDDLTDKVLLIRFKMNYEESCKNGDTVVTINDVKNTLTCRSWKYKNENDTFDYAILNPRSLDIKIKKGRYDISYITTYILDYKELKDIVGDLDTFIFNKSKTKGDKIAGNINVRHDGYFSLSIPYDTGFKIYVDGKKVSYELVNEAFIGFKINKGKHDIKIVYSSPLRNISLGLSSIGLLLFIVVIVLDKRGKNEKRKN